MNKRKFLLTLAGPTAVGKTPVAVELATHFGTEIISADSRQIYREMKIGTAIPSPAQLQAVPHHFIGSRSIQEYYNASMFEQDAVALLTRLFVLHDMVIMAGGSGMYMDAVCKGIDDFPTVNAIIRENLRSEFQQKGMDWLRSRISESDPDYYSQADINNPKRLLKALEIITMTGRPYSSFLTRSRKERDFTIIPVGLTMERKALYQNINRRVDFMIGEGLVAEVKALLPFRHLNALNTVGYKEIFGYLDGKTTLEEAIDLIKRHSRQYARRQITWFKKNRDIRWFAPEEHGAIIKYVQESMEKGKQ
ncbi:MAG: tRNA (adenosine(37)-N6)-dimethylallyltransferase MiaA [Bacteroidetes bacterium RBG_13_46_8]|nr:MAG: tRNA (adenosine(37)-N6)-dimethylallyltransferase MiaA [Bacteroidetes bacterium RBG_13_46_8]